MSSIFPKLFSIEPWIGICGKRASRRGRSAAKPQPQHGSKRRNGEGARGRNGGKTRHFERVAEMAAMRILLEKQDFAAQRNAEVPLASRISVVLKGGVRPLRPLREDRSNCRLGIGAEPGHKLFKGEVVGLVKAVDEDIGRLRIGGDAGAVNSKEGKGGGECCPFVAVDERMVLPEAFPQGGRFLGQANIVAGLRTIERGFEQAGIA
jgi:hypothetical protein